MNDSASRGSGTLSVSVTFSRGMRRPSIIRHVPRLAAV